jgi:hypothetical protein
MKNHPVTQTEYYKKVKSVVDGLNSAGMLENGSGYCLSMSDIVHKLLHKEGIKSRLVECSLMVTLKSPPGLYLMGYPGFNGENFDSEKMLKTHIICVTETEVPILIDLSISHIDKNIPFICVPIIKKESHTNIAEYDFETSTWTYQEKVDTELPKLHQRSILDRIEQDNKVTNQINSIKSLILLLFTLTSLNFVRGTYDFYQKYVNQNNDWGPNKTSVTPNK